MVGFAKKAVISCELSDEKFIKRYPPRDRSLHKVEMTIPYKNRHFKMSTAIEKSVLKNLPREIDLSVKSR